MTRKEKRGEENVICVGDTLEEGVKQKSLHTPFPIIPFILNLWLQHFFGCLADHVAEQLPFDLL